MPTLHHPDLDLVIVRNERQAKVLADSGWVDVTEPEPARNDTTEVWGDHSTRTGSLTTWTCPVPT